MKETIAENDERVGGVRGGAWLCVGDGLTVYYFVFLFTLYSSVSVKINHCWREI